MKYIFLLRKNTEKLVKYWKILKEMLRSKVHES